MRFLNLGVLQIETDGALITPGGPRTAAVLSALLLHLNQRVTTDLLINAAWGHEPPQRADQALSSHIWRLRRLLEPTRRRRSRTSLIHHEGRAYRLTAPTEEVSSTHFEQLGSGISQRMVDEQPSRALELTETALDLWRGAPFTELADRPWAAPATFRLERLQLHLQERRLDALIRLGDYDRAIIDSENLLRAHPLHERLWANHMLACYRSGRIDEALGTYQQARRILHAEAAIDPGTELVQMHQQILRRDPSLDGGLRGPVILAAASIDTAALPRRAELIGRRSDLVTLDQHLRRACPLLSIIGPAGCGKTAVASEVARAAGDRYPDGVRFVDLSTTADTIPVLEEVATTLGLAAAARDPYRSSVQAFTRTHHALIVLDNCEQVLADVTDVCQLLLGEGSAVQLILTSREPLGLADETVHHLKPLSTTGTAADPLASPAAMLFLRHDRLTRTIDDLSGRDRAAVARICNATDGLPLALELASSWTASYTLTEIAKQLEHDPGALASATGHRTNPHHTMHLAVDRSYQLLDPEEQALHRRLGVLPGPFSRQLAEELAGDILERRSIGGLLARLQHRSLLTVTHHTDTTKFTQFTAIRAHAQRALADAAETDAAEARRDAWILELFQRRPLGGRPEEAAWHAEIQDNLAIIRAALRRNLQTHPNALGAAIACRMLAFWFYRGHTEEGLRWVQLAADRVHDTCYDLAIIHATLASLHGIRGDHDAARASLDRALNLRTADLQQPADLAEALISLASVFSIAYDTAAMRCALSVAQPIVKQLDSPHLQIALDTTDCLADTADNPLTAPLERAFACFERAEHIGNLWAAWLACSSVNTIALARGDAALGLGWSRRLITLQDRLGAQAILAQFETYADFLALHGNLEHSVRVLAASHQAARRTGAPWPRNAMTPQLLDEARQHLTTDHYDQAWALGSKLSRAELLQPYPPSKLEQPRLELSHPHMHSRSQRRSASQEH